jgi:eukaryotic-like serine/threonine-protein kinase
MKAGDRAGIMAAVDPERWRQVRTMLEQVLDRPAEERAAYLAETCADDVSLLREVESLAHALDDAGSFIETPAVDLGLIEPPPLAAGASLGRFVILELVGRGGMGVVYAAYDPRLDRRVALKLLPPRTEERDSEEERLLREAQALARLSHPNVITVYDVGAIDGRVFIAMEFVVGQTLGAWLRQTRRSWRDILGVFLPAGRGLEAAHAAGLVHRDFKPGNVLVGRERVVVVDFGLARVHGLPTPELDGEARGRPSEASVPALDRALTHAGALLGTPAYMAPEQRAGGTSSAAADQFSFCVALYEAVYGQRPFDDDDLAAPHPAAATPHDPPTGTGVPSWLGRILNRGLRIEPAERFPSMGALLGALSHDPRQMQRRWWTAAGAVAVVVLAVLAASSPVRRGKALCSGAGARLAGVWDGPRRQALDRAFRATGLPFADDARRRVRAALDTYAQEWTAQRIDTCEATHVRGEQSADLLDRKMACLDQGLQELGAVAEQLILADATRVEGAVRTASSLTPLARCRDTSALMALLRAPADDATRVKVEDLRRRIAEAKTAEDLGEYDRGLTIASAAVPDAEAIAYWPLTAEALLRLGALQEAKVQPDDAASTLNRALLAAQAGRHDRVAVEAFARLVRVEGSFKSNRAAGHRYAAHAQALLAHLQERGDLESVLFTNVGKLWFVQAEYDRALEHYGRALVQRRAMLGPEHPQVAETLSLMGHVHLARGALREALIHFEQALTVSEKALGPAHPKVAIALDETGRVLHLLGNHKQALERHRRALNRLETAVGPDHQLVATVLVNIGNASVALDDPSTALRAHTRAQEILERTLGPKHPAVALVLTSIGNALINARQHRQALAPYRRALALQQAVYGADHPSVAATLFNLGEAHRNLGEHARALEHYRRALAIWEAVFDEDHYLRAYGLTGVGEALLGLGRAAEARGYLERAIATHDRKPLEPRALGVTQFALARALRESPDGHEKSLEMATRAIETFRAAGPAGASGRAEVEGWLDQGSSSSGGGM